MNGETEVWNIEYSATDIISPLSKIDDWDNRPNASGVTVPYQDMIYITPQGSILYKYIRTIKLTGDEAWTSQSSGEWIQFQYEDLFSKNYGMVKCTHIADLSPLEMYDMYKNQVSPTRDIVYNWEQKITFYLSAATYPTLESFTQFLKDQETAGTPVWVEYTTMEPTEKVIDTTSNVQLPYLLPSTNYTLDISSSDILSSENNAQILIDFENN